MKPVWKVVGGTAYNMNSVFSIEKCGDTNIVIYPALVESDSEVFISTYEEFETEAERDEAFEYLMRDDRAECPQCGRFFHPEALK
jgi:hypothetical protein